jgi:hypothetical protein
MTSAQLIARPEGWIAYRSIYLPSMSYSPMSTSFTRRELATIQRSPIRALPEHAARSCLRSNLPRGSWQAARRHPHYCSTFGNKAASENDMGVDRWRTLPHSVGLWLPSLCEFLADSECTIEITNTYTVCIRQAHDRILMEDAMTVNFTDSEMRDINRCRVFLRVECLSDVCTANGLITDPGLQAQPPTVVSQSTIK